MTKKMAVVWKLHERLEHERIHSTTDLASKLAERGVQLSRMQVHRLVTETPQRLNMDVLAALCDILNCTPTDLIEVREESVQLRKRVGGAPIAGDVRPIRARLRVPGED